MLDDVLLPLLFVLTALVVVGLIDRGVRWIARRADHWPMGEGGIKR